MRCCECERQILPETSYWSMSYTQDSYEVGVGVRIDDVQASALFCAECAPSPTDVAAAVCNLLPRLKERWATNEL